MLTLNSTQRVDKILFYTHKILFNTHKKTTQMCQILLFLLLFFYGTVVII